MLPWVSHLGPMTTFCGLLQHTSNKHEVAIFSSPWRTAYSRYRSEPLRAHRMMIPLRHRTLRAIERYFRGLLRSLVASARFRCLQAPQTSLSTPVSKPFGRYRSFSQCSPSGPAYARRATLCPPHLRCQIRSGGNLPSVAGRPTPPSAVLLAPIVCAPFLDYSQLPYLDLPSNPSTKDFENHPMADWNLILDTTRSAGGTSPGWTQLAEVEYLPAINRKDDILSRLV